MGAEIRQFTCRRDNFGVLLHEPDSGLTLSIDAPEEGPIVQALEREGWRLTHILTTHHHDDHVSANEALKARFGAEIIGPAEEAARIPGLDRPVRGGDRFALGAIEVEVIDTPGHTAGEISYFMPGEKLLFAADALFSLGGKASSACAPCPTTRCSIAATNTRPPMPVSRSTSTPAISCFRSG